ncbi:SWIM zinc finger family protein [Williamsia sp. M5A3_1d]
MSRRKKDAPVRGYGLTAWSRAVLAVIDRPEDTRRVTKARGYFRDRTILDVRVRPGMVTALVQGSQVEPFETSLTMRTVEPDTVVALLREKGATEDLLAVARGEQPRTLGSLVLPTEPADVRGDCNCPDDEPRCIHVLALGYEMAARIDKTPSVALTMMGAEIATLLAHLRDDTDEPPRPARVRAPEVVDFYGAGFAPPPLPSPPSIDVFADLDVAGLNRALRMSGVGPLDVGEVTDELAELYARLTRTPPA